MKHIDASEVVIGAILNKEIDPKSIDPEDLVPPFPLILRDIVKGKDKGALLEKHGSEPILAAQRAREEAKKIEGVDWPRLLRNAKERTELAIMLEKRAYKLKNGDDVDGTEILSQVGLYEERKSIKAEMAKGLTTADLFEMTFEDTDWIVDGLLPPGLHLFAGRENAGKSVLSLQLLKAIATGGTFLGKNTIMGKALYIDLEDSRKRLIDRMKLQEWIPDDTITVYLEMEYEQVIGAPLHKGGLARLREQILLHGYKVVVIDTMGKAFAGVDIDKYQEVVPILSELHKLATETNSAIIIITHLNKQAKDDFSLDDVLGSVGTAATCDNYWKMVRKQGERTARLVSGGRDFWTGESITHLEMDPQNRMLWIEMQEAYENKSTVSKKDQQLIKAVEMPDGSTQTDLAKAVDRQKQNVASSADRLIKAGYLTRDNKSKLYFRTSAGDEAIGGG